MISISIGILLLTQAIRERLEPTSRFVGNLCVASAFDDKLKTDKVYLARRDVKGRLEVLLQFNISRRDRNVRDVISVYEDRIVALVNGGVDLFEPFFIKKVKGQFVEIKKPEPLEGCPGRGPVAIINGYQICYVNCGRLLSDPPESVLFVFSTGGLKFAKIPFSVGLLRSDGHRFIQFEKWTYSKGGRFLNRRWVSFRWPLKAKNGFWVSSNPKLD